MKTRKKTGGRKAGTPNKKTQIVEEILNAIGCNQSIGFALYFQIRFVDKVFFLTVN